MDLWIRSQDKEQLIKAVGIRAYDNVLQILGENSGRLTVGVYDSEARAIEVLDEIVTLMKNRYIVKPSGIISIKDIANENARLNYLYNGEFIMENPPFEIEPINSNIIYYEMPEE